MRKLVNSNIFTTDEIAAGISNDKILERMISLTEYKDKNAFFSAFGFINKEEFNREIDWADKKVIYFCGLSEFDEEMRCVSIPYFAIKKYTGGGQYVWKYWYPVFGGADSLENWLPKEFVCAGYLTSYTNWDPVYYGVPLSVDYYFYTSQPEKYKNAASTDIVGIDLSDLYNDQGSVSDYYKYCSAHATVVTKERANRYY